MDAPSPKDNKVYCWGMCQFGSLGNGESGKYCKNQPYPVPVKDMSGEEIFDAKDIFINSKTSCAVRGNHHEVWCWGANHWGNLGDSHYTQDRSAIARPVKIGGATLSDVIITGSHQNGGGAHMQDTEFHVGFYSGDMPNVCSRW